MITFSDKYKDNIMEYGVDDTSGVERTRYKFDNGYGASVINGGFSYGLEVAVIRYDGDGWTIDYSTPITSDVIGYVEDLDSVLDEIKSLE